MSPWWLLFQPGAWRVDDAQQSPCQRTRVREQDPAFVTAATRPILTDMAQRIKVTPQTKGLKMQS